MALRVAVIGSGPSGFYTADALIKRDPDAEVAIIERLPVPYGLVRFGVAPDHQGSKKIVKQFEKTAADPRVSFFGNVELGRDVSLDDVRAMFDAVVFACGAALDRRLDIPGEDLPGVVGSADFVGWYNGHPDFAALDPDLNVRAAVVVGNGNVAIDVARILSKTRAEMREADLPDAIARRIDASPLRDVYLMGRRGPADAAFTNRELAELGDLERAVPLVDGTQLPASVPDQGDKKTQRVKERNLEILKSYIGRRRDEKPVGIHMVFYAAPVEILGASRVEGIRMSRTRVEAGRAVATGETFDVACGLVIRCIGYRSRPIDGVPFDDRQGRFRNEGGRIGSGLYAVGWAKRGPSGVISTNYPDGVTAAEQISADLGAGSAKAGGAGLRRLLEARGVRIVDFDGWRAIDQAEIRAASPGAPRRKFVTVPEMLAAIE